MHVGLPELLILFVIGMMIFGPTAIAIGLFWWFVVRRKPDEPPSGKPEA